MFIGWDYATSDVVKIMLVLVIHHEVSSIIDYICTDEYDIIDPHTFCRGDPFEFLSRSVDRINDLKEVGEIDGIVNIGDLTAVYDDDTQAFSECVVDHPSAFSAYEFANHNDLLYTYLSGIIYIYSYMYYEVLSHLRKSTPQ